MPSGVQVKTFVAKAAEWAEANEVMATNYLCMESDTGKAKLGDGVSSWGELPYIGSTPIEPGSLEDLVIWNRSGVGVWADALKTIPAKEGEYIWAWDDQSGANPANDMLSWSSVTTPIYEDGAISTGINDAEHLYRPMMDLPVPGMTFFCMFRVDAFLLAIPMGLFGWGNSGQQVGLSVWKDKLVLQRLLATFYTETMATCPKTLEAGKWIRLVFSWDLDGVPVFYINGTQYICPAFPPVEPSITNQNVCIAMTDFGMADLSGDVKEWGFYSSAKNAIECGGLDSYLRLLNLP